MRVGTEVGLAWTRLADSGEGGPVGSLDERDGRRRSGGQREDEVLAERRKRTDGRRLEHDCRGCHVTCQAVGVDSSQQTVHGVGRLGAH